MVAAGRRDYGEGGIRTLGSLLDYGALAKRCFRPLSHLTNLVARISGRAHARQQMLPPFASLIALRSRPTAHGFGPEISHVSSGCTHAQLARRAFAPVPSSIGEVAIANLVQGFVLIDIGRTKSSPPPDAELRAENSNGQASARLRVTPERKPPFITADIVSGSPARGDRVYP